MLAITSANICYRKPSKMPLTRMGQADAMHRITETAGSMPKPHMKIDTHQHYWRYRPDDFPWITASMSTLRQDRRLRDSLPAMQACGVDAVVAVQARGVVQETEFLLTEAASNPRIVGVVGWVDLMAPDLPAQLDAWANQPLLRGFRHILQDEPDIAAMVDSSAFGRGVALLQRQQFTYDVLVFEHQLPLVLDFCSRQDAHWLVLDHVAKPALRNGPQTVAAEGRWSSSLRALAALPHVMCKLSGLVTETDWLHAAGIQATDEPLIHACFDFALEVFGPQRLMFGSDWPVCELAAPYQVVCQLAQSWCESRLSPAEQQLFWAGNALRCYGLPWPVGID